MIMISLKYAVYISRHIVAENEVCNACFRNSNTKKKKKIYEKRRQQPSGGIKEREEKPPKIVKVPVEVKLVKTCHWRTDHKN